MKREYMWAPPLVNVVMRRQNMTPAPVVGVVGATTGAISQTLRSRSFERVVCF